MNAAKRWGGFLFGVLLIISTGYVTPTVKGGLDQMVVKRRTLSRGLMVDRLGWKGDPASSRYLIIVFTISM